MGLRVESLISWFYLIPLLSLPRSGPHPLGKRVEISFWPPFSTAKNHQTKLGKKVGDPRNLLGHPSRKHLVFGPTSPLPQTPCRDQRSVFLPKKWGSVFSSSPSLSLSLSEFSFFFDLALDEKSDDSFNHLLFFFEEDLSFEFWKRTPFSPLLQTFSPLFPGSSSSPKGFLRFFLLFQRDFRFFPPFFGGFPSTSPLPPSKKANLGRGKVKEKGFLPLNFHSQERPESERVKLLPKWKKKEKERFRPFFIISPPFVQRERRSFSPFLEEKRTFSPPKTSPSIKREDFLDLLFPKKREKKIDSQAFPNSEEKWGKKSYSSKPPLNHLPFSPGLEKGEKERERKPRIFELPNNFPN